MRYFIASLLLIASISLNIAVAETGVTRGIFTTAIHNKEPVSDLKQIATDVSKVYFFTELKGLSGHKISHRWEYNGKVMAEVSFEVDAQRWRTWSSKNILQSWQGEWLVSVVDEGGNLIEQKNFEYIDAENDKNTEKLSETKSNES